MICGQVQHVTLGLELQGRSSVAVPLGNHLFALPPDKPPSINLHFFNRLSIPY